MKELMSSYCKTLENKSKCPSMGAIFKGIIHETTEKYTTVRRIKTIFMYKYRSYFLCIIGDTLGGNKAQKNYIIFYILCEKE